MWFFFSGDEFSKWCLGLTAEVRRAFFFQPGWNFWEPLGRSWSGLSARSARSPTSSCWTICFLLSGDVTVGIPCNPLPVLDTSNYSLLTTSTCGIFPGTYRFLHTQHATALLVVTSWKHKPIEEFSTMLYKNLYPLEKLCSMKLWNWGKHAAISCHINLNTTRCHPH